MRIDLPQGISEIKALRESYLTVVEDVPASKPDVENGIDEELEASILRQLDEYQMEEAEGTWKPSEPLPIRILGNPRLIACIISGLCVLGTSAYAALAFWWYQSGYSPVPSDEPVAMLSAHDDSGMFKNIDQLEKSPAGKTAAKQNSIKEPSDEPVSLLGLVAPKSEAVGRANPFDPLVQINQPASSFGLPPKPRDVLEDVQFTGFIGDAASKDKVAILRITDPMAGDRTVIKKAGESFSVEGVPVYLKAISKNSMQVKVNGRNRTLYLAPYVESEPSSESNEGAAGQSISPGNTAAASSNAASAADTGTSSNPATPRLEELR